MTEKKKATEPQLARLEYCTGCENAEKCSVRQDQAKLSNLNTKRTPHKQKYNECHTIFNEYAARPPDDKETRRKFGEGALHY